MLFVLAAVYLLLFNPRTENSTYCLLGPALGICYAQELIEHRRYGRAAWLLVLGVAAAGSYELSKPLIRHGVPPIWLAPLAATLFAVYLSDRLLSDLRRRGTSGPAGVRIRWPRAVPNAEDSGNSANAKFRTTDPRSAKRC